MQEEEDILNSGRFREVGPDLGEDLLDVLCKQAAYRCQALSGGDRLELRRGGAGEGGPIGVRAICELFDIETEHPMPGDLLGAEDQGAG